MTINGTSLVALFVITLPLVGCGGATDDGATAEGDTPLGTSSQALTSANVPDVSVTSRSISFEFAKVSYFPAGIAAGEKVIFIGDPLEGRVIAYSRLTGREIGELPPPPGGFALPFIMHASGEGKVQILGAGGLPQPVPFVPAHPFIYEYSYDVSLRSGFSSQLTRFVDSGDTLVGFPEDFTQLSDGRILLTDAVLGSIWIIERDGTFTPGIVPRTFNTADAIPTMAICPTMPQVTVNGVPFLFSGSTIPGITGITERKGTVYFSSSCARGVFSFPLSILRDHRQPYQRAADIRLVSGTPSDLQVEELLELQFNPYDKNDPYMYAAHGMQLEMTRIDSRNGRRETVARDAKLFDFPSSLAFLPPLLGDGPTSLVVASNQQERTPITNDAVTEDSFDLPFTITKVIVTR